MSKRFQSPNFLASLLQAIRASHQWLMSAKRFQSPTFHRNGLARLLQAIRARREIAKKQSRSIQSGVE
eukprot:656445-Rhodomonas_salina.1